MSSVLWYCWLGYEDIQPVKACSNNSQSFPFERTLEDHVTLEKYDMQTNIENY